MSLDAAALWSALARLSDPSDPDADAFPCVRLGLRSGQQFDVYRAEKAPGDANIWRVRGFLGDDEQRALLLGTVDGRAMVSFGNALLPQSIDDHGVDSVSACTRPIDDLSSVMAARIRRLFEN